MSPSPADLPADAIARWQGQHEALEAELSRTLGALTAALDGHLRQGALDAVEATVIQAESGFASLRHRLDQARSAFEGSFEAAMAQSAGDERRRLRWQRAELRKAAAALSRQVEERSQELLTKRQADAARALFERASDEWNEPRDCPSCGAEVPVGAVWRTTQFTCARCGTVSPFGPAPQTARFYEGPSLDHIGAEHALPQWRALHEALRAYGMLRHPTTEDFEGPAAAAAAWARAGAELQGQLHPAWDAARVDEVAAARAADALGGLVQPDAVRIRALFSTGLELARSGDLARVMAWLRDQPGEPRARDPRELVGALVVCVHEHGHRSEAWQMLALQHHVQQIAQDRDTWMRDQLTELDEDLRTR